MPCCCTCCFGKIKFKVVSAVLLLLLGVVCFCAIGPAVEEEFKSAFDDSFTESQWKDVQFFTYEIVRQILLLVWADRERVVTNDRLANYYFEAVQRVSPEIRAAFDKALAQHKEYSGLNPALVGWSTAFGLAWLSVSCFWLATIPLCLLCCGHPQASRHPHRMAAPIAAAVALQQREPSSPQAEDAGGGRGAPTAQGQGSQGAENGGGEFGVVGSPPGDPDAARPSGDGARAHDETPGGMHAWVDEDAADLMPLLDTGV